MLFDIRDDGFINTSVREICEFLRRSGDAYVGAASLPLEKMKKGVRFHRDFQHEQQKTLKNYCPEYRLCIEEKLDSPFVLNLSGIADGIAEGSDNDPVIIDEIKTTSKKVSSLDFGSIPVYDLQLYCYAYMYMKLSGKKNAVIRLIYHNCDSDETNIVEQRMEYDAAREKFREMCDELLPWIRLIYDHRIKRNDSIKKLEFPFGSYRKGQRELCGAVYRCVRDSITLFAQAPTGTGKTVSTLFPAYKALGEDRGEKIFYLTAKAVQRSLAKEAILKMTENGLYTRMLVLTAKSKSCLSEGNCMPHLCKYSASCFDRMNDALWDIINNELVITPEIVAEYSEKHEVCPHELALDTSYFCDCVVGDYNHLYDPQAALQRYFSVGGDYIALVDEAHNLPDRARDMYTAILSKSALTKAHRELKEAPKKVRRSFSSLASVLRKLGKSMTEKEESRRILGVSAGYEFESALEKLCDKYKGFLGEDICRSEKEKTLETFFDCNFMLQITMLAAVHPDCFRVYAETDGKETVMYYTCTNPAPILRAICDSIRSTVYFSATLSPFDYYTELLCMREESDKYIRLPSPFDPKNQLVAVYTTLSTRLKDREGSYEKVSEIIYSAIKCKTGNYLVFFPSFRYLSDVLAVFEDAYPEIRTVVQESNMDDEKRAAFLENFEYHGDTTLLGFAVCGGLFSEGIDLVGDRLSGVIIIGTGMPSICFERDLIRSSFESGENVRRGFNYAYTYPGLNRVFQAAGRVIRTESDKGFIVLCDDRYNTSDYYSNFPSHWGENMKYIGNTVKLEREITSFWNDNR